MQIVKQVTEHQQSCLLMYLSGNQMITRGGGRNKVALTSLAQCVQNGAEKAEHSPNK